MVHPFWNVEAPRLDGGALVERSDVKAQGSDSEGHECP